MSIESQIWIAMPDAPQELLDRALKFALDAMIETRTAYREPVALLEVSRKGARLELMIVALYTKNTMAYSMEIPAVAPGKTTPF